MTIIEILRKEIETCGKSRYQINKDTGIDNAALCRIMQGGSCKAETADILLKYFGLELKPKRKKGKLIDFEFGRKTTKVVIGKKKAR